MAPGPAELTTLRDALVRARATGTRSVTLSDGKRVEYRTDAEMATAIGDLEARIARASGPRPGALVSSTSKGLRIAAAVPRRGGLPAALVFGGRLGGRWLKTPAAAGLGFLTGVTPPR